MPVLRQNHMVEAFGEPVDDRHDRIALADPRARPPGQKSFCTSMTSSKSPA